MHIGLGLGLTRRGGGASFSPFSLFASGEAGAWYDPSDLSTLYQDSIGTTPVTAAGQPVGLVLDKSQGLTLGAELVTNGGFDTDTAWTKGSGWTILGGVAVATGAGAFSELYQSSVVSPSGGRYRVSFNATISAGTALVFLGTSLGFASVVDGANSLVLEATGGGDRVVISAGGGGFTGTIDNISVRELPGNHLTQVTAAARPVYARGPETGRRNLLTYTEQFDNAAWLSSTSGVAIAAVRTANAATAPDGTETADRIVLSLNGGTGSGDIANLSQNTLYDAGAYRFSVWLKSATGVDQTVVLLVENNQMATVTVTSEWQRFEASRTVAAPISSGTGFRIRGGVTGGVADLYVWGAQLETGATATAYQRVVSDFDVTEAGVNTLHWLEFDGVDDWLVPGATLGFDGTGAWQAAWGANRGSANNYHWSIGGTSNAPRIGAGIQLRWQNEIAAFVEIAPFVTDTASVLGVVATAAASSNTTGRINGAAGSTITRNTIAGSSSLAIASGETGSLVGPLDINFYGGTWINRNLTADELAALEAYLAAKTGVVI